MHASRIICARPNQGEWMGQERAGTTRLCTCRCTAASTSAIEASASRLQRENTTPTKSAARSNNMRRSIQPQLRATPG
eukprot:8274818-Alexandrium_andersonii.AAC.1